MRVLPHKFNHELIKNYQRLQDESAVTLLLQYSRKSRRVERLYFKYRTRLLAMDGKQTRLPRVLERHMWLCCTANHDEPQLLADFFFLTAICR